MCDGFEVDNVYVFMFDGEDFYVWCIFFGNGQSQSFEWIFEIDGKLYEILGMMEFCKVCVKWCKEKFGVSYMMKCQMLCGLMDIDVIEIWKIIEEGEFEIVYVMCVG